VLTSSDFTKLAEQVIARCRKLATFSEDTGGTRRTFLSAPMRDCHREVSSWMKALGMTVSVDAVGNLRGFYSAVSTGAPRILMGSHLDTVPNAGAFDGILGVVLAIGLMESLAGMKLPYGIEVIGFSEEEGVRFGVPFLGSRALTGRFDEDLLGRRDRNGISVREAIQQFGLNDQRLGEATLANDVLGYLEFHIEQGPVLEKSARQLGVVEAIVGQTRLALRFLGRANHSGTTPMDARQDALAAAAEWMVAVESYAKQTSGLVATVGSIEAKPGATNVIPGEVRLSLDVRHRVDEARSNAVRELSGLAEAIARKRGLCSQWNPLLEQNAVLLDGFLADQIESAIRSTRCHDFGGASSRRNDISEESRRDQSRSGGNGFS